MGVKSRLFEGGDTEMQDWMPRTDYEQAHVNRILKFETSIPLETDLNEASKMINAELAAWQKKDGFWFAEENRPQPSSSMSKQQEKFFVWMPLVVVFGTALSAFLFDSALGFGAGVVAFLVTPIVLFLAGVISYVALGKKVANSRDEMQEELASRRQAVGIRTDYNGTQKRQIETRAKWYLNYVAMAQFKARVSEAGKADRDHKKRLARKSGVFATQHKPAKQPYGVSDEGAEYLVAQWMIWLGVFDAQATKFVGDGGIDVESSVFIAQVKNFAGYVGVADIRELKGVSAVDGRIPLFFTSGEYSKGADDWSQKAGVHLFQYDAKVGVLRPKNKLAEKAMREGLAFVELESK